LNAAAYHSKNITKQFHGEKLFFEKPPSVQLVKNSEPSKELKNSLPCPKLVENLKEMDHYRDLDKKVVNIDTS
jgi:hypothetical protein